MPVARIRGVDINFEVIGNEGPWVTYCGGGRSDLTSVRPIAAMIAGGGYRVVIHDRRNCGASEVSIDDPLSEQESWVEDTYELLSQLGALPVFAGGASAGCRLALILAIRHPEAVAGLFVSRPSGGAFAARYLAESNYDEFLTAAQEGGMEAVCDRTSMRDVIARNPSNRERLLSMDTAGFVRTVERWRRYYSENGHLTLMGVTDEELSAIDVPICIIAGQDDLHPRPSSERFHRLVPQSEIHYLFEEEDIERVKAAGFTGGYATLQESPQDLTRIYLEFLGRAQTRPFL
jgi:pimeloyl-ACP methyl ester carboxylesterase